MPTLHEQLARIAEKQEPPKNSQAGFEEERAFNLCLLEERQTAIEGQRQDISERKVYASKSFNLVSWWLIGVFSLLLLHGLFSEGSRIYVGGGHEIGVFFKLSDSVLIAVVGGTTASVIGIFIVVANYLFPKK